MVSRKRGHRAMAAGFSLMELLVVIAILGLVAGVTAARLSDPNQSTSLKAESRKLITHLRATRSKALGESRIYTVESAEDGSGYAIRPGEEDIKLPQGIELSLQAGAGSAKTIGTRPSIRFFPDGSASGGVITLRGLAGQRKVAVNWMTGEVAQAASEEAINAPAS
ncbi:type II secretion system protein GspH [Seongchinamella unica]|uniref:Type II secretion system protein H n=1 Tax=Seongchinamella unica TaxID=2547392 RepID=A0A4R5LUZ1_9GAMM|nr:GspH/FimT family pseudopilin [Seongchinamella unica]TDG15233.1 type II secretion system protein GspH [Seongchinamella unica]